MAGRGGDHAVVVHDFSLIIYEYVDWTALNLQNRQNQQQLAIMVFKNARRQKLSFKTQIALIALTLTGCTPFPNFSENQSQYKSVAVVSLLPRTITMTHIGVTVFNNDGAVFPLDWDPNTVARQTAIKLLSQNYQIKDLGVNTDHLMAAVQQNYSPLDMGITENIVRNQLKATVGPGQVNLIVVIDASTPPTFVSFDGNKVGWGLISTSGIGSGSNADGVSLVATLEVIDGTTFKVLARGYPNDPDVETDNMNWRGEPYKDFTPAQKQALNTAAEQAIRGYVASTLKSTNLISN